jgi:hypothetical protein
MLSVQPTMQHNMPLPDELAALLARNLTFNPELQAVQQQASIPTPQAASKPITYSISQHYHHSGHAVKPAPLAVQQEEPQRRSSAPADGGEMLNVEAILRQHNINPATLTPSQVQLFRVADQQQQLRLLELWSICPPNNGRDIPSLAWSSTTVEHEEQLAQLRYERQQQNQMYSLDGTPVQSGDGRWQQSSSDSEPYMLSGYEELMRREREKEASQSQPRNTYSPFGTAVGHQYSAATDPVYMGPDSNRLQQQQQQQQQMSMANQYGVFQQQRDSGDSMDMMY